MKQNNDTSSTGWVGHIGNVTIAGKVIGRTKELGTMMPLDMGGFPPVADVESRWIYA